MGCEVCDEDSKAQEKARGRAKARALHPAVVEVELRLWAQGVVVVGRLFRRQACGDGGPRDSQAKPAGQEDGRVTQY